MDRIPENGLDFKDFEQWCYDMGMAFARMLMQTTLTAMDDKMLKERDRSVYRAKDMRPLTVKTLMGEVSIKRRLYKKADGGYTYLLDETINLDTIGKVSVNVVRRIAETITECSYRSVSDAVSFMTGQQISHMGVWNIVQAAGEKITQTDTANAKLAKRGLSCGTKEIRVLHEEFDGVWINMQGKDRPKKGRKSEMKLAACYEGMEYTGKDSKGKSTYDMVNPLYMAGFEDADKFYEKKEGQIGSVYNLDEIDVRLINGDGGSWVQGFGVRSSAACHLQLDPFHIKREIMKSGLPKEKRAEINNLSERGETTQMLAEIKALAESETDPHTKEKTEKMLAYFSNNKAYLVPIKNRGLKLPSLPEGVIYGNMGTMEGNVCNIAALRMKRRKASFTKTGAVNLARLICFKRSGGLDETIYGLSTAKLPMIIEEVITTVLSAAKSPNKDGKGYAYPVNGGIPFADAFTTNGRRAVKGMAGYRAFTDLGLKF
jgi:hypothetical protein